MRTANGWRNWGSELSRLDWAGLNKHVWATTMKAPPEGFSSEHQPVLLHEVLDFLMCRPGGIFVDATLGLGGHAEAILQKIQPGGRLIGVDRDKESLERVRDRLLPYAHSVLYFHENFKNLPLILNNLDLPPLDGILADLGVSSYQLLSPERGFSFQGSGMLDMRMDRSQTQTAAGLVNQLPVDQIADLIHRYGEERYARRIAKAIVRARSQGRISQCAELARIIESAVPARGPRSIHPATRTFQALRIAVNEELEGLEEFLADVLPFVKPGGRVAVISFHSLEDRIVKRTFRKAAGLCVCNRSPELCTCPREARVTIITPRPATPRAAELKDNPRARSARLRIAERI